MQPFSIDIRDLARTMAEKGPDKRGIPEAQVMRLQEALQLYRTPNPYQPGDLVTPRKDAAVAGAGDPHIVLDTIPRDTPLFSSSQPALERRYDVRIGWIAECGHIHAAWFEAWEFEPYAPPTSEAAAAAQDVGGDATIGSDAA